jgi:hypothetical protein
MSRSCSNFRCQVRDGTDILCGSQLPCCTTKINDERTRWIELLHSQVRWLDVSMHDALAMKKSDPFQALPEELNAISVFDQ